MAQTGFTPIQIYYSTTPDAQPLAADLLDGELALNIRDGVLFYKDYLGNVQVLSSVTGITNGTFSGGTTGLTPNTPTVGNIVLGGVLNILNGGTGATTPAAARTNLELGSLALQSASSVAITGGTITNVGMTVSSNNFYIADTIDPAKQAQFNVSGITTGTTRTYTLPNADSTLIDDVSTQTISGIKTFANSTINVGSSALASTQQFAYGLTATGLTKTVNIGTGGLSGSTTAITLGTNASGATSTIILNGNVGVGTATPGAKLAVVGTAYSPNIDLVDAATIAWDTSLGQTATFTFVSSNRTMGAPTNLVNGGFYALAVYQNAGSNTLVWDSVYKWAAGSAPTLTATAGGKDFFVFRSDGVNMYEQGRALGDA